MNKVRLYSYQPIDFDITKEKLDLSKSINYLDFQKAYDWLFSQIGTDQILWTMLGWYEPSKDFLRFGPNHAQVEMLWELEVPQSAIIRCIDSDPWNSVISEHHIIPDHLYEQWESEGDNLYIDQQWDKFCDETLKEETWQSVFVPFKMDKYLDILLPFPIKEEWVVRKSLLSGYETYLFEDLEDPELGTIEMPFKNELKAIPFLGAIETALRKQDRKFLLDKKFERDRYHVKFIIQK